MNKKYDWPMVESYFLGEEYKSCSLLDISERYGIPYQTVRRYAASHKWHSRRYRAHIRERHGMDFEEHLKVLYKEAMNRG